MKHPHCALYRDVSLAGCAIGVALWVGVAWQGVAQAATVTASVTADVESIIRTLVPGDELVLEDGLYDITDPELPPYGRFAISIAGTPELPIVIRAAEGAHPHFSRGNADENIWDVTGANLIIRGLTFSGGSVGVRIESARNLTIEECEIYGTEGAGLSAPLPTAIYDGVRILRNRVHDTGGAGMRFGCQSDLCRLANAEIVQNHVHHTGGSGEGILIREGGYANRIVDNVVHDTAGPCVVTLGTLGHGDDQFISANLLFRCAENGIQAAGQALITNNVILSAGVEGISMRPYASPAPVVSVTPTNISVLHNTVLMPSGNAVALDGATGPIVLANNALYAQAGLAVFVADSTAFLTPRGNVGIGQASADGFVEGDFAADFVDANFSGAPPMDVFPRVLGALVGTGDSADVVEFDFNGTARGGVADVGAYVFDSSGNSGWVLAPVMKGEVYVPEADAGVSDGAIQTDGSVADGSVEMDGSMADGSVEMDGSMADGSVEMDGSMTDGAVEMDGSTTDASVEIDGSTDGSGADLDAFVADVAHVDGGVPDSAVPSTGDDPGGCSCRDADAGPSGALPLVLAAIVLPWGARRRRRNTSARSPKP